MILQFYIQRLLFKLSPLAQSFFFHLVEFYYTTRKSRVFLKGVVNRRQK